MGRHHCRTGPLVMRFGTEWRPIVQGEYSFRTLSLQKVGSEYQSPLVTVLKWPEAPVTETAPMAVQGNEGPFTFRK